MHALVTGATGFLGRYIVEQLVARGDWVRAFVRREDPQLQTLGVEQKLGDLRDRASVIAACQDVDMVFHVASIPGIWGDWQMYYDTNIAGTLAVIDGCRQHKVQRLVYTSSPSVTFDGRPQADVDESAPYPTHWLAHYPHSKAIAERMVLGSNSETLATCALRPHLIWGPRDPHLVPRLIERAKAGELQRVGDGMNLVSITYVENAAEAHLLAGDKLAPGSDVAGKAYFIAQGEPVNCWQWIDELLALAGLDRVRRGVPLQVAYAAGAMLERAHRWFGIEREPRMTRFLALQLGVDHYFNLAAAHRDFGYRPRVSTAEGMERLRDAMCR